MPSTLTLPFSPWTKMKPIQKRITTQFDSGKMKIKAIWSQGYKRYDVSISGLTTAQKATLKTSTDTLYASAYFYWTPPGESQGNYMFEAEPEYEEMAYNFWKFSCILQEIPV